MKHANVNVDYIQVFVTINNTGTKINAGVCDKGVCDKECHKSVDKLVEECTQKVNETKITEITENKCKFSCIIHVVIIAIDFIIFIEVGTYYVYSHWYLKSVDTNVMFDARAETTIY